MAESDYEPSCKSAKPGDSSISDEYLYQAYRRSRMSFREFSEDREFLTALPHEIKSFLKRDDLLADTEEDIYFALDRWYQKHPVARLDGYIGALPVIRFALLSSRKVYKVLTSIETNAMKLTEDLRRSITSYHWEFARQRVNHVMANPTPRTPRADLKKYLYVLGAPRNDEQFLQCYDIDSNSWTFVREKIPISRIDAGIAAFNGCVWVAGGQTASDRKSLDSVCSYDPNTQMWSDEEPMNQKRCGCALATHDGKLYAVGGRNEIEGTLKTSEYYDGSVWKDGVSMKEPRENLELVSEIDELFAAGGLDRRSTSAVYRKSMEYHRPTVDSIWCIAKQKRLLRPGGRLVSTQGIVYFVGWDIESTVVEYQAFSGLWGTAAKQTLRIPRKDFAAAATSGIIYVVGGSMQFAGEFQETKSLQNFDPLTGETTDLADTVEPAGADVRAVIVERTILPE